MGIGLDRTVHLGQFMTLLKAWETIMFLVDSWWEYLQEPILPSGNSSCCEKNRLCRNNSHTVTCCDRQERGEQRTLRKSSLYATLMDDRSYQVKKEHCRLSLTKRDTGRPQKEGSVWPKLPANVKRPPVSGKSGIREV